jgi:molybdate transport system substrate-binding protein
MHECPLLSRARFLWLALMLVACRGSAPEQPVESLPPPAAAAPAPPEEDKLVVFAAASLRDAFNAAGEAFKPVHPGVALSFNFAGSQELRTQIEQGAPADVFASADQRHMGELLAAKQVNAPTTFARNEPVMVVASEQAGSLKAFADLPKAKKTVFGVPEVPIGRYTLQILDNAKGSLGANFRERVEAHVVSRELNVKQVLSKLALGEADAAIVYRTDALNPQAGVSVVTIPSELNVVAEYPIASVTAGAHPKLAAAWVEFVLSAAGQGILQKAGFLAPAPAAAAH